MHSLSEMILSNYQIRKTRKQKSAFIDFLQAQIPTLQVEEGGLLHNRNLVVGDIGTAKVIFGAHYDTCAQLPFPNLIFPKNFLFTILYGVLVAVPFFFLMFLSMYLLRHVLHWPFLPSYWLSFAVLFAGIVLVFFAGPANRHTANDNTSGVIMLCELMKRLDVETRQQVAFVFFDNEENGLLGSARFRKVHKRELAGKLLVNFDCVSDGDHLLLVQSKTAQKRCGAMLAEAFFDADGKTVHLEKSATTMYPSDQAGFPNSLAVAFLNRHRILGLYMNRIHTSRDTVFDESNIEYLCAGTQRFLSLLLR